MSRALPAIHLVRHGVTTLVSENDFPAEASGEMMMEHDQMMQSMPAR